VSSRSSEAVCNTLRTAVLRSLIYLLYGIMDAIRRQNSESAQFIVYFDDAAEHDDLFGFYRATPERIP